MSRPARRQKAELNLHSLEEQFYADLVASLKACAAGAWGLFGQNDHLAADNHTLRSAYMGAAQKLLEQGEAILRLRQELGFTETYESLHRFMAYRDLRGSNVPGEPKLAAQLLKDLGEI